MGISLFAHNQQAYERAASMLERTGKAAVIHPTGTGKSFIAFRLAQEHAQSRVLWLSPSEYIFKTQLESVRREDPEIGGNITFLTYARLLLMNREQLALLRPDYVILDEFHRCGTEKWGQGVALLLHCAPQAKVLGLSATNVRYLDNQRDMAQELFDGNIASEMTLGEAIVRGILPAPKYVTSVYAYTGQLEKLQRRAEQLHNPRHKALVNAYVEKLRRALEMSKGLPEIFARHMENRQGKYLVFCSDFVHLQQMQMHACEWFALVDENPHIYTAYASDPQTSKAFQAFKEDESDHLKLLFSIDMLNEGIHVAGVDGVVLFRPTVSPIIYKQQIGRALSTGNSRSPVIFDIVNNFDNLYSISSMEQEMYEAACRFYGVERAGQVVAERFHLIDEVRSCREIFGALQSCMDAGWDAYYAAAKEYRAAHGDLKAARRYKTEDGLALGDWLATQRRIRAGKVDGRLSSEQIARLDELGMVWGSVSEMAWMRAYEAAKAYFETYGNLLVPRQYETGDGIKLGAWVMNQRQNYATYGISKRLTPERITRLNEIGMVWSAVSYQWEQNFAQAAKYYETHGNLEVPADYETADGFRLGGWIQQLRANHNGNGQGRALTAQQTARLDDIGMRWTNRYDGMWQQQYENAKRFYQHHGHLDVPVSYMAPDGSALGKWISRQRSGAGRLSAERVALLNQIGMLWAQDPWQYRFSLAKDYKNTHGTAKIPAQHKTPDGIWLGKWLYLQKKELASDKPKLTEEQKSMLQQLLT